MEEPAQYREHLRASPFRNNKARSHKRWGPPQAPHGRRDAAGVRRQQNRSTAQSKHLRVAAVLWVNFGTFHT